MLLGNVLFFSPYTYFTLNILKVHNPYLIKVEIKIKGGGVLAIFLLFIPGITLLKISKVP